MPASRIPIGPSGELSLGESSEARNCRTSRMLDHAARSAILGASAREGRRELGLASEATGYTTG